MTIPLAGKRLLACLLSAAILLPAPPVFANIRSGVSRARVSQIQGQLGLAEQQALSGAAPLSAPAPGADALPGLASSPETSASPAAAGEPAAAGLPVPAAAHPARSAEASAAEEGEGRTAPEALQAAVWNHATERGFVRGGAGAEIPADIAAFEPAGLSAPAPRASAGSAADVPAPASQGRAVFGFLSSLLAAQLWVEGSVLVVPQFAKSISDSFLSLAFMNVFAFAALAAGGLAGGFIVQRFGIRAAYLGAMLARTGLGVALAALYFSGGLGLPALSALFGAEYFFLGVSRVAEGSLGPALYGADEGPVNRFGIWKQMVIEGIGIVGPWGAGYLIAQAGVGAALAVLPAIMIVGAVLAAVWMRLPKTQGAAASEEPGFEWSHVGEALRALWASKVLRHAAIVTSVIGALNSFLYLMVAPAFGLFVAGALDPATVETSRMTGAFALGGVLATILSSALAARPLDFYRSTKAWTILAALAFLSAWVLFSAGPASFLPTYVLMPVLGFAATGALVPWETLLRTRAPDKIRPTLLGLVQAGEKLLTAAGFVVLGGLFDLFSVVKAGVSVPTAAAFLPVALAATVAAAALTRAGAALRPGALPTERSAASAADDPLRGKRLLFVWSGFPERHRVFERAKELGVEAVLLDNTGFIPRELVSDVIPVDASRGEDSFPDALAAVRRWEAEHGKLDGIVTFWEDSILLTALLGEELGLPYHSVEAARAARSKSLTQELLAAAGIDIAQSRHLRGKADLEDALAEDFPFPAILKPDGGIEAMSVVKVHSAQEAREAFDKIWSEIGTDGDPIFGDSREIVLMEYLDGDEFDMDLGMQEGDFIYDSVTDNWPTDEPFFVPKGVNLPSWAPEDKQAAMTGLGMRSARALGFKSGVLHVEGKHTSRGPRILELNARMGGIWVRDFILAVYGVDLIELQLRVSAGVPAKPRKAAVPRTYLTAEFLVPSRSGLFDGFDGVLDLLDAEGFYLLRAFRKFGEWIRVPPQGYQRAGMIAASGKTAAEAKANFDALRPGVAVRVRDPKPGESR